MFHCDSFQSMFILAEEACPAGLHHSGFSCRKHQPKIFLKYQTFRQLTAAFINDSGLQSVHVLNVWEWQLMMWGEDKSELKMYITWMFVN